MAESAFKQLARGPAYSVFLAELKQSVTAHWISGGRQLCDAVSLTGTTSLTV